MENSLNNHPTKYQNLHFSLQNAQEANWELVIMLVFINLWSDK